MSSDPQHQPFSVETDRRDEEAVVVLRGDLDVASADALGRSVRDLRAAGHRHVVIDLSDARFLDSTGLGALIVLRNDAKRDGQRLTLVPGPPAVQRVFALTRTRGLFEWRSA